MKEKKIMTPLRILLVEDNETDVILIKRAIGKIAEAPEIEVVEDLESCRAKMINFVPDVVISDYNLPTCSGLDVFELVQRRDEHVPFIFLTGTVHDEELAANTMLSGATGYILKKHMPVLEEKLKPLFKKVVFRLISRDDLRERLRQNKIAVNQIYDYLDTLHADNEEQKGNLTKLKQSLREFRLDHD